MSPAVRMTIQLLVALASVASPCRGLAQGGVSRRLASPSADDDRLTAAVNGKTNDDDDAARSPRTLEAAWSNWPDRTSAPRVDADADAEAISDDVKRGRGRRRHGEAKDRELASGATRAQLKELLRNGSRQPPAPARDVSALRDALANEMEANERLKTRLDTLEVQINTLFDVAHQLSQNVSAHRDSACDCPDTVRRQELDSIRIHQRRIYLMLNAQEERHRDVLDLVRAYRSMVYSSADVIGELEERIQTIQSDIRIQRVKLDKLNLDLHWRHVQQDLAANDTKHVKSELVRLQRKVGALSNDQRHVYVTLDQLGYSYNKSEKRSAQLRADFDAYQTSVNKILKLIAANRTSRNSSVSLAVDEMLRNVSGLAEGQGAATKLWPDRRHGPYRDIYCLDSICDAQVGLQRQLDGTSLDVEQLKDEMAYFFTFLQAVQADIRHFRGQEDEAQIRGLDIRRIKAELTELRRNVSRLEGLSTSVGERDPDSQRESSGETPASFSSGAPASYRTTPGVRSAIRKASRLLSIVNAGEASGYTTARFNRADAAEAVSETPPITWLPTGERSEYQKESPESAINRQHENQLDKGEFAKNENKQKPRTSEKARQNDVKQTNRQSTSLAEGYTARPAKSTEKHDLEIITLPETISMTTVKSPPYTNEDLSYRNGLRVKPSESDVCSLPGIMVGHATPVAKFADIQTGAWMRDPESRDNHIYVTMGHSKVKLVKVYNTTEDLVNKKASRDFKLPIKCTGTGHVMYNGSFYCNKYKSNRIVRYDTRTNETVTASIKSAGFDNSFPYTVGDNTDVDFAVDEIGLWAIYSGFEHGGSIVVGKVDPATLRLYPTWETGYQKKRAVNAFMVCGRLYVVAYNSAGSLELSYVFDTLRGRQIPASHQPFYSVSDAVSMMAYNPKDSKLYAWVRTPQWQGQLTLYGIFFVG